MGITFTVEVDGQQVRRLPDPAGGTFDAAGDMDRLLPASADRYPVLAKADPDEPVLFNASSLGGLIEDIERQLPTARPGPERRGLERLRALAEFAQSHPGAVLRSWGY